VLATMHQQWRVTTHDSTGWKAKQQLHHSSHAWVMTAISHAAEQSCCCTLPEPVLLSLYCWAPRPRARGAARRGEIPCSRRADPRRRTLPRALTRRKEKKDEPEGTKSNASGRPLCAAPLVPRPRPAQADPRRTPRAAPLASAAWRHEAAPNLKHASVLRRSCRLIMIKTPE
jgi:hypothetical protein